MAEPLHQSLLDLASEVAAEAFAMAARMRAEGVDVAHTKTSLTDVVTAADTAVQALIRERLLTARPGDGFLGEEGNDKPSSTGIRWVVDPIDGTVNYYYGISQWAVSIAAETEDQVVAGVVHSGAEVYRACLGGGAYRGQQRLAVRERVEMGQRLVHTGFNYQPDVRRRQGEYVAALLTHVRDVRRMGSSALDICMVAAGLGDGYVEECSHHWDRAAASLVAIEAGASFEVLRSPSGNELVVCSPTAGHAEFVDVLRSCGFIAD